jgi:hypothetical protein
MTTTVAIPLLAEFVHYFETGEDPDGIISPSIFVDFNVPSWRFQLVGNVALERQRQQGGHGHWKAHVGKALQTPEGFVLELDYEAQGADGHWSYNRTLSLITVADGKVTEMVHYCGGPWDIDTSTQHAASVRLLRP